MKADLHCHTVLSDGAMRVDQIIPYAKRIGLDYIAISDHESTHSIPEAVKLGKELGVHAGSFHDWWNRFSWIIHQNTLSFGKFLMS